MADYYTQTVVTAPVLLTTDLADVLSKRGATTYPADDGETVLDGIVNGRPPLRKYSVVFEQGWSDDLGDFDTFEEWADWEGEDPDEFSEEFKRLSRLHEHELIHEVLKVNPELEMIELQSGWTCSKMRLDGFGGSSLHVNRKGYLYVNTHHVEVDEDGFIQPTSKMTLWETELAAK
jgi:hypothetical protein